jgi:predicted small secreted protein
VKKFWLIASVLIGSAALTACTAEGDGDDEKNGETANIGYVSIRDASIREGDEKATYQHDIRLSTNLDKPVTVNYETRNGTARTGEDYETQSGKVTFSPGTRRVTIEIPILGDVIHEPDEYFEVHLSGITNARMNAAETKAAITIQNDDERPSVAFVSNQQSVSETVGTTQVTARLSAKSGYTVEAELSAIGTALMGNDYTISEPLMLTFEPGETEVNLNVDILQDTIPEGGETIKFAFENVKEASRPNDSKLAAHTIIILGDTALNDTGLMTFSDGNVTGLSIEPSTHPGQDASYGRDTEYHPDFDGQAGFSFTKLDYDGNPMAANSPGWNCTRDNVTGLVWENKRPDQDLGVNVVLDEEGQPSYEEPVVRGTGFRAGNFVYGWREDDDTNNGGSPGIVENRATQLESSNPVTAYLNGSEEYPDRNELPGYCGYEALSGRFYCNSRTYIEQMNIWGVCGFNDWRMPSIEQLRSLANHNPESGITNPEPAFFFNIKSNARYLSDTPAADNESSAWCYDFGEGEVKLCQKGSYRSIIAVRNKQ